MTTTFSGWQSVSFAHKWVGILQSLALKHSSVFVFLNAGWMISLGNRRLQTWVPRINCYMWRSFGNVCCGRTHYSSDLSHHQTIICLVLWKKSMTTSLCQWWGTAKRYVQVTVEAVYNTSSCSEVQEDFWKRWRQHRKITMPLEMLYWSSIKFSYTQLVNNMN